MQDVEIERISLLAKVKGSSTVGSWVGRGAFCFATWMSMQVEEVVQRVPGLR